ncbi:MAG: hypothetical protein KAS23_08340 [Anaerohalosphaera sp.]|nr:hypothetical protein [Anaerohalosphaera sp.]
MKRINISITLILTAACLALSACDIAQPKPQPPAQTERPTQTIRQPIDANRFQSTPDTPTAVETSIKLSQEKADLADKLLQQKDINKGLSNDNVLLKQKNRQLTTELEQANTELNQTNRLLMDTRTELDDWKAKILEFQKESRDTDKAQLEALYKMLQILGGQNEN